MSHMGAASAPNGNLRHLTYDCLSHHSIHVPFTCKCSPWGCCAGFPFGHYDVSGSILLAPAVLRQAKITFTKGICGAPSPTSAPQLLPRAKWTPHDWAWISPDKVGSQPTTGILIWADVTCFRWSDKNRCSLLRMFAGSIPLFGNRTRVLERAKHGCNIFIRLNA